MRSMLCVFVLSAIVAAQETRPTVEWRSNLALARVEAKNDQKPLLVVFRCER